MNRSPHIRSVSAFVSALLLASLVSAPGLASAADAVPGFTIKGGGNGHGIGMSQYGAQGYAINGMDYRWILGYYFKGTRVEAAPAKNVKVRLDAAASVSNAGYTRSLWSILPGNTGTTMAINGVLKPAGTYTFVASGANIVVSGGGTPPETYSGTVAVTASGGIPPLLQVVEGTGIYSLANGKYRGSLTLNAASGAIKLVNVLPLEEYLYGVVPRESPASWRADALKAQAVAARSYAYPSTGEIYCDTRSQAYQGYGAYNSKGQWVGEVAATNAAVDATAGEVVKYGTAVVTTYFFSSSGGHTANIEDSWGYSAPKPYYTGVPDPHEAVAGCPDLSWEVKKSGTEIGNALRASTTVRSELTNNALPQVPASPTYVVGVTIERGASGYPRWVSFRFNSGATIKLTSYTVKSALGLKSPNFSITGFPIERIQGASRYETAAAVSLRSFETTAPAVVVASGEDYADALTGTALAGATGGSLLLTAKASLPAATASELARLRPSVVYIMGGTAAVTAAVETAIRSIVPTATVKRVAGANRYETSRVAAETVRAIKPPTAVLVVSGTAWPDAASASALAYALGAPILLTPGTRLGADADAYLRASKPATSLLVGGSAVLAAAMDAQVKAASGLAVRRIAGADRFATAAEVARFCVSAEVGFTVERVYVATGAAYADALSGGVLAGRRRSPLLLTSTDACPPGTAAFLLERRASITGVSVFGGPAAVSQKGLDSIASVMMQ